eukprot:1759338-Lingulodinium_polyedra.AAC.1
MAVIAFSLLNISFLETGLATHAGNKGTSSLSLCLDDVGTVGIAGTGLGLSLSSISCIRASSA